MELVYSYKDLANAPSPGEGEMYLLPEASGNRGRRDMTGFVLQHGVKSLLRGPGSPVRLFVTGEPTLDDMLAASVVEAELEGLELPPQVKDLARYAALAREGLRPGEAPLESSIEGIFLAIRNEGGLDLSDPAVAEKFNSSWRRMAAALFGACAEGKDLFKEPVFDKLPEFARERAFLREDKEVYRHDVAGGERWLVKLPGGPPEGSGLILNRPKSLLWKYWSRQDREAPAGGAYLFLGVTWQERQWVFSTDPVQRISLKDLAAALQAEEDGPKGGGVSDDKWFDGKPFGYTLVAAPRGGTRLDAQQVLKVVARWAGARKAPGGRRGQSNRLLLAAAAMMILVLAASTAVLLIRGKRGGPVDFRQRGKALENSAVQDLHSQGVKIKGYALVIGVGDPQDQYPALGGACPGAAKFYCLLRDRYGIDPANKMLLEDRPSEAVDDSNRPIKVYGKPDLETVLKAIRELGDELLRYPEGERTNFFFYYGGHGQKEKRAREIGHLVLSGFDRNKPDQTGFGMSQLSQFLQERIASSHQILVLDSCFSGFTVVARGAADAEKEPFKIYEMWKKRAHVILTAGTRDQQSWEADGKSVFTEILSDAIGESMMADANKDGIVTDAELGQYLSSEVPRAVQFVTQQQYTMTPQYFRGLQGDDVGQFLFIPNK